MNIAALGLDFKGRLLVEPMDERLAARALVHALERNVETVRSMAKSTTAGTCFRSEVKRISIDPGDPRSAGWTYLVNSSDPRKAEIESILQPLAEHRHMVNNHVPLLYNDEPPESWMDWMYDNYYGLKLMSKKVPQFILIVGGPQRVPFLFQSLLSVSANVGRVDFDDDPEALRHYVEKLIRIETAAEPTVSRDALLFAPDGGISDPTHFSSKYMVQPIARHVHEELGFHAHTLLGGDATKTNLTERLGSMRPAIVYTASHGLGATDETADFQKRYNGAICCQHTGALDLDALFSADDIPDDRPFLEGALFFQFACFGYGTPAESDYAHWLEGVPKRYTKADFVAALPKKLLAHPRGPVAYVGHLDTAFLHAFADPNAPHTLDRWHNRISPFVSAVEQLLRVQPSGLAMHDMNARYSENNMIITSTYDRLRRSGMQWDEALEANFLDTWITRGDAQNYMVFGDPAARLRIPAG